MPLLLCSEVAKFCQKYMADEITKLEHYHQGRLSDCLVEVFHRIDLMLRDDAYSNELATLKRPRQELAGPDDKLENNEQGQGQVFCIQQKQRLAALWKACKGPLCQETNAASLLAMLPCVRLCADILPD